MQKIKVYPGQSKSAISACAFHSARLDPSRECLWCMLVVNLHVPGEIRIFNINCVGRSMHTFDSKAPTKHDSPIYPLYRLPLMGYLPGTGVESEKELPSKMLPQQCQDVPKQSLRCMRHICHRTRCNINHLQSSNVNVTPPIVLAQ